MKDSVEIIEEIIKEGAISDANLRLLVNKIIIFEKDKKLKIKIKLNAKFQRHKDCYDEKGKGFHCIKKAYTLIYLRFMYAVF